MVNELISNEIALLAIFLLSIFVGFEVVSKVSTTLHTPLMSGANAIHGVILVGAIVVADHAKTTLEISLAIAAVILATINMVGGFVVTDRMLQMFKGKPKQKKVKGEDK
jgi:NAD(P) transhydrogenase subunit alpha